MDTPILEKLMTAEELLLLPESDRYELVKGELIEMSPPPARNMEQWPTN